MRTVLPRLLALSLTAAFPLPAFATQTYALVVGVDSFPTMSASKAPCGMPRTSTPR